MIPLNSVSVTCQISGHRLPKSKGKKYQDIGYPASCFKQLIDIQKSLPSRSEDIFEADESWSR